MERRTALKFIGAALLTFGLGLGAAKAQQTISINSYSYAAIAYSQSTGEIRYAANYGSRSAAEQAALRACKASDARIVGWVNNGFLAMAVNKDGSWGYGHSWGDGANSRYATQVALGECNKRGSDARIVLVITSDGQYVFDRR